MISATWVQDDPSDEPELLVRLTRSQAAAITRGLWVAADPEILVETLPTDRDQWSELGDAFEKAVISR